MVILFHPQHIGIVLFEKIEHYNSYLTYAGVGILLVCVAFIVYNACKRRENKTQRQK